MTPSHQDFLQENLMKNKPLIILLVLCQYLWFGEGNGTPLQHSCLENPTDGGAWWAAVHGVAKGGTRLSDFTFTVHFHALEKEMATHSSVLAWRVPGTGEPGGLPSMGSHSRTRLRGLGSSSSSGSYHFSCFLFLSYVHTLHGVLKVRILKWFANPFSSGPHSVKERQCQRMLKLPCHCIHLTCCC